MIFRHSNAFYYGDYFLERDGEMKTKIYIVRHTQTVGNIEKRLTGREDYELTNEGKEYVQKLFERLKDIKFDSIYSSISGRAVKTIEPIAKNLNKEIVKLPELQEMYFGIYDGWKWEDVNKVDPKIKQIQNEINEIANIPEQETTEEVKDRMYDIMHKLAVENLDKTILISSHGVAIEAFLRKVTGEEFCEHIQENSQKNTSVNIVEYDDETDSFNIKLLNDLSHLNIK